jgi:Putative papain-like cysteine peptidase (DUF1796)
MIHYISIGPYCESANILEKYQRRPQAFPFDFIFSSLPMIRHVITDRCSTFLDKTHLTEKNGATHHAVYAEYLDTDILRRHHYANQLPEMAQNMKSRPVFLHHNLLEEETHKAFQRRCERLLSLIDRHEKIVFMYFNPYLNDHRDLFEFADSFHDYPNIRIVGIADNQGEKSILYHGARCKVYQRYNREEMFHDIEQSF